YSTVTSCAGLAGCLVAALTVDRLGRRRVITGCPRHDDRRGYDAPAERELARPPPCRTASPRTRAPYPTVSPPDRHRPPPVLFTG
ncbi:hypothetical protein, partial [Streptomyces sp. NPDC003487]